MHAIGWHFTWPVCPHISIVWFPFGQFCPCSEGGLSYRERQNKAEMKRAMSKVKKNIWDITSRDEKKIKHYREKGSEPRAKSRREKAIKWLWKSGKMGRRRTKFRMAQAKYFKVKCVEFLLTGQLNMSKWQIGSHPQKRIGLLSFLSQIAWSWPCLRFYHGIFTFLPNVVPGTPSTWSNCSDISFKICIFVF